MAREKKNNNTESNDNAVLKEKDEIHQWLNRIDHVERYRKGVADRYRWAKLIEEYRGNFDGLQNAADIYVPSLNLIFAYVKSEIPSLYLRDPKIKVNPRKGSSILSAKILERALNYLWRTKRLKRENKKNVLDALLVGHSWFKTGYTGQFGTIEDGNGNTFEFVQSEDFFGYRVPYENITFNPDANDPPYDCTWIAHKVVLSQPEAQKNKRWDLSGVQWFEGVDIEDPKKVTGVDDSKRFDPTVRRGVFYEVWNKNGGNKFIVSPGVPHYIDKPGKWPYAMRGFPFSFLRLNDDPLCPYGIPDCYMFEPQVMELMKIRAAAIDHIKRFSRQLLLAQGHMDPDTKDQFMQGVTGAVLEVRTDGKPLGDIVAPIPYPQLQTDVYAIEERIKEDMINVSGQSPTERGASQKTTTRTVRELIQIRKGAENRRSDKVDTVEDFIEDIAGNLVALLQQLADVPFFVAVTGENPEEMIHGIEGRPSASKSNAITTNNGFTFTKEDIQGEFDFEVVAGSTTPLDQEQKIQTLVSALEMAPQVGAMPGGPVIQTLAAELADEFDLPPLRLAMVKEAELANQMREEDSIRAEKAEQLQTAQTTADIQIKAEREATRQNETLLKGLQILNPNKKNEEDDDGE